MTIKEIEQKTGMTRANIRYYEAEGLIAPQRNPDNGYRIYSQEDAETLMKIRLLRCLDISIEDVKAIQAGRLSMEKALRCKLEDQEEKQQEIKRTMELTRQMLNAGVAYETLDAAVYLQLLESEDALQRDREPHQGHPWRRYAARCLDSVVYGMLAYPLLRNLDVGTTFVTVVNLVAMLLLEPLQLRLFGTTIGKAILGLRLTDLEEQHIRYSAGLERTWMVLWEGMGLRIPLVEYYFLYKSYNLCEDGEFLPWEWDSEVTCKDDKLWRWGVYFLVFGAVLAVDVLMILMDLKLEGIL